jgi:DmsE family decaheme c-type cytochrome
MMNFRRGLILSALIVLGTAAHRLQAEEPAPPAAAPVSTPAVQQTPQAATSPLPTPVVQQTPIPVAPPPVVVAKENLKADYIGADACLACHANQAGFKESFHARMLAREKGIDFQKTCETCHGPGSLHGEAAGDHSNPGFATINNMKGDASATCLQCHNDQKRLHWAGSAHNSRNLSCVTCHSVHNPKSAKNQLLMADEKLVCFQCHANVKSELTRNSPMPVLEGKMTCSDCHNPHGSSTDKLLAADSVNQLCFKCHTEKRGPFLWTHPPV